MSLKQKIRFLGFFAAFATLFWWFSPAKADVLIDDEVSAVAASHAGSARGIVFVSDQVGYIFYRDNTSSCAYKKTTDGGTTWSVNAINVVSDSDCGRILVWYDRWTPGNTTGTNIHIVTMHNGTPDVLKYNRFNTANDTLLLAANAAVTISTGQTPTFQVGGNYHSLAMATNGTIYAAVADTSDSFVVRCSTTCQTAANWSEVGTNPLDLAEDPSYLMPLSGGDMLLVVNDISADDILSKVWNNTAGTWSATWTTIDNDAPENSTYDAAFSMSVDLVTNNAYLAYCAHNATLGTDDSIHTAVFSNVSRTWTATGDVVLNDAKGITGVSIARDSNLGNTYVLYGGRPILSNAQSANVYWKVSSDNMSTWSAEQGPINTNTGDMYGVNINLVDTERVYVAWVSDNPKELWGMTLVNLVPPTFDQSAYRILSNTDTTDVGAPLAAANTPASLGAAGMKFRLRSLIHVTGDGIGAGLKSFKLQFVGKGSGTCAAPSGGTPSAYTDVTTSTAIAFYNNPTPADGAALTANANDPTHSGHTIRNQTYEEANNFTNSQSTIVGGEDGKWDFALRDNGAPASTTYCFRAVVSDGSLLSTYTVYPELTTSNGLLAIDIVDASGVSVASPSIDFPSQSFNFDAFQSTATLGVSAQKIRISNNTATATWTAVIAASGGPTVLWTDGALTYDFNGTATTGRLRVDPSVSTLTPLSGCSTTGLTKGSATYFNQGVVDSVTLVTAGSSAETGCYWDMTGVSLRQDIPEAQDPGTYTIGMVLTIS